MRIPAALACTSLAFLALAKACVAPHPALAVFALFAAGLGFYFAWFIWNYKR